MKKIILLMAAIVSLVFIRNISAAENIPIYDSNDVHSLLDSYSEICEEFNSCPEIREVIYVDKEIESGYAIKLTGTDTVLPVMILSPDRNNIQSIGISCRINNQEDLFTAANFLFIHLKILTGAEDPEIIECLDNMIRTPAGGKIYSNILDRTYYMARHRVNDKIEVIAFTAMR